MAANVVNSGIVARFNFFLDRYRRAPQTATCHIAKRYWEVSYSDRDKFAGKNVETFLRDYNLYIEVTQIRKDGVNISKDDFNVPKSITECLENENKYPTLFEISKAEIIKELINKDYLDKWDYQNKKADEMREKKDKLCFNFIKDL